MKVMDRVIRDMEMTCEECAYCVYQPLVGLGSYICVVKSQEFRQSTPWRCKPCENFAEGEAVRVAREEARKLLEGRV